MKQPDLFDMPKQPPRYPSAPGWTEPTTSKAAAKAIRPVVGKQHKAILDFMSGLEFGATQHEICAATGLYTASVCGRMVELVEAGKVRKTAKVRKTPSGRNASVYEFVR